MTLTKSFPRAADGSFVYAGDQTVRHIDLGGVLHRLNVPGDAVLAGPLNAGSVLESLATAVDLGDVSNIVAALQDVEALRQQIVRERTEMGLAAARFEKAELQLISRVEGLTASLSEVEDADIVQMATDLSRLGFFLEANLGAAGQAQQRVSLFDVLT